MRSASFLRLIWITLRYLFAFLYSNYRIYCMHSRSIEVFAWPWTLIGRSAYLLFTPPLYFSSLSSICLILEIVCQPKVNWLWFNVSFRSSVIKKLLSTRHCIARLWTGSQQSLKILIVVVSKGRWLLCVCIRYTVSWHQSYFSVCLVYYFLYIGKWRIFKGHLVTKK